MYNLVFSFHSCNHFVTKETKPDGRRHNFRTQGKIISVSMNLCRCDIGSFAVACCLDCLLSPFLLYMHQIKGCEPHIWLLVGTLCDTLHDLYMYITVKHGV